MALSRRNGIERLLTICNTATVTIKAKKIFDNTGEKVRSKGIPDRDKFVFEKMKQCYFDHDVAKLKRAIR